MQPPIQSHIGSLLRDLREGTMEQRQQAAENMHDQGSSAGELLCRALRDKDLNVRSVAAEALGHIGDVRAIQPLVEALRERRRPRWKGRLMLMLGSILLGLLLLILSRMLSDPMTFDIDSWGPGGPYEWYSVLLGVCWLVTMGLACFYDLIDKRRISQYNASIIAALVCIAERNPAPELRNVLPDLKAIAADVLQQEKTTRTMSRQAARRIETLTEQLKSLPLPAAAPVPDAAVLPRAAESPAPNVETLPRVTDELRSCD